MPSNAELIAAIDDVLITTQSLARDLRDDDADRPTACPGWTVRDQLAHIVGLEQVLDGAPQPDVELPASDHVHNDLGRRVEQQIHVRRGLPLVAIADELAGLRPRRIAELKRLARLGDPAIAGPFGERPMSSVLPIRVLDLWTHEQDIRRAVGLPVRTSCAAAAITLDQALASWSVVLPKRVAGGTLTVRVLDRTSEAVTIDLGPDDGSAALAGDTAELTAWFAGRDTPDAAALSGDPELVASIASHLVLTP